MSLLDLILAQKGILLTAGMALLLLAVALILSAISRVRRLAAAYAHQKLLRAARSQPVEEPKPPEPVEPPVIASTSAEIQPQVTDGASPAPLSPEALLNQALTAPENQPEEPTPDGSVNPMQDILSSVFGDEEVTAKYDIMLNGLEPITIESLRALSAQIADQLQGQLGSPAANR